MYAVTRRYQFDPAASQEISNHINDGFIPLVRQTPGFVAYYWMDTGEGVGISMGVFESPAGADESVRIAGDYVRENLAHLLGTPEITKGEVWAYA
jgi:hypothetical protein